MGAAILAYLFGSLPLGFLLRRYNFLRLPAMLLSIGGDFAQGVAVAALCPLLPGLLEPLGLGVLLYPLQNPVQIGAVSLLMAMTGHYFSVYICGWGGLGTALIMGGFLVLTPRETLGALAVFALALLVFRRLRLASLAGGLALPLCIGLGRPDDYVHLAAALLAALVIVLTHTNFLEIRHVQEN